MPVVLLLAALAILAGVVAVAIGRGGELAMFRPDTQAQSAALATAADVAAFRPPLAFFGYSAPATDDALQQITAVVAERDAEVAWLRDQVHRLGGDAEDWSADPEHRPEIANWPRGWTYAAQERRADAADWSAHAVDAEPEAEAEPEPEVQAADVPEPGWSDSGWSGSAASHLRADSTGADQP
ncbi:MAG TPA: hypothetical protein VHU92_10925 [Streptosporangiaceae bacterium]|jgi:hypothetical protein|nr:hypothetical protein [Streptosporangiaceae bacterium]